MPIPIVNYVNASGDGQTIYHQDPPVSWASAKAASNATSVLPSNTTIAVYNTYNSYIAGDEEEFFYYEISRGHLPFDTSAIPDDATINSATVTLYSAYSYAGTPGMRLVTSTQASGTTIANADYGRVTSDAASNSVRNGDQTLGTALIYALNATGLAAINTSGYTMFGLKIEDGDYSNSFPAAYTYNTGTICSANHATLSYHPRLSITYTEGTGTELVVPIAASTDDWYRYGVSSFNNTAVAVQIGHSTATGGLYNAGFRFVNVAIPAGATIVSAYLAFVCSTASETAMDPIHIALAAVDSAGAAPTTAAAHDTYFADLTTEVTWTPDAWVLGETYPTPNIASILQEVIDREGWASGNTLAINVKGSEGSTTNVRTIASWNHTTLAEPQLIVNYTEGEAGVTLTVQDGTHTQTADSFALTQKHLLSISSATHTTTSTQVELVYDTLVVLEPADTLHTTISEAPNLIEAKTLAVNNSAHAPSSENVSLTQKHLLEIQDDTHATSSEEPTIEVKYLLEVQDSDLTHISENVVLGVEGALGVQDSQNLLSSEEPNLTEHKSLTIQDGEHITSSEELTLLEKSVLEIQDSTHSVDSDNVDVTLGVIVLKISDCKHGAPDLVILTNGEKAIYIDGILYKKV